jgi:hypothetical protein
LRNLLQIRTKRDNFGELAANRNPVVFLSAGTIQFKEPLTPALSPLRRDEGEGRLVDRD